MSLHKLQHSLNEVERNKATVLTLHDARQYLLSSRNSQSATVPPPQIYLDFNAVSIDNRQTIVPLTIVGSSEDFQSAARLFGSSGRNADFNSSGRVWNLCLKEWPLLTVELVGNCLKLLEHTSSRHVPALVEYNLPAFFPHVDFLKLLDFYRNDLLLTDDPKNRWGALKNMMCEMETPIAKPQNELPDSFSI